MFTPVHPSTVYACPCGATKNTATVDVDTSDTPDGDRTPAFPVVFRVVLPLPGVESWETKACRYQLPQWRLVAGVGAQLCAYRPCRSRGAVFVASGVGSDRLASRVATTVPPTHGLETGYGCIRPYKPRCWTLAVRGAIPPLRRSVGVASGAGGVGAAV